MQFFSFHLVNYNHFLFFIIILSQLANTAGSNNIINIAEHAVPLDIVMQIFAAIAEAKFPTINVTIISIDADVNIVWMDLL